MRSQNTWQKNQVAKSISDNATAVAYLCWKIALGQAKELYVHDFEYDTDEQRTGVIREYLIFLIHIADRLTFVMLNTTERKEFISILATETSRHYKRNVEELYPYEQDYTTIFLNALSSRTEIYSHYSFNDDMAGYQMLRSFGNNLQNTMKSSHINKWVVDQTIEIDAPHAVNTLKKGLLSLFSSSLKT